MKSLPIGFFQFENLVRNRVPFYFVSTGISFEEVYSGPELEHLKRYLAETPFDTSSVLKDLEAKNLPKHHAVLVLCLNGIESQKMADQLGEAGYSNCFYVLDGWTGIKAEAKF